MNDSVTSPEPHDPPPPVPDRVKRKKDRVRSAWISFTGRILAQLIGAAATVAFGLLFLHKGSSAASTQTAGAASVSTKVSYTAERARKTGQPVVAVLPLDDYSNGAHADHFVDSLTDALITDLSQSDQLRIISRTSAMHFKAQQLPIPDIARELSVDFVVEGSAVRDGARIRVTAQLINARTDEHVWARSYDRSAADAFSVQAELASVIAREIDTLLTGSATARLSAN